MGVVVQQHKNGLRSLLQLAASTSAVEAKVLAWAEKTFNIPTSTGSAKTDACNLAQTAIDKEITADLDVATGGTAAIVGGIGGLFGNNPITDAENAIVTPV